MKRKKNQSRTPTPKYHASSTTIKKEYPNLNSIEVQGVLKFFGLSEDEFGDWMTGQTQPILPDGQFGVFHYDLHRFVVWKIKGIKPVWD